MLFNSFPFIVLVLITGILFYSIRKVSLQNSILILASFTFYAWNYLPLLLLLVSSIAINALVTQLILTTDDSTRKKIFATVGVIANLCILSFFKYGTLVGRTLFTEGNSIGEFLIGIPLPIGISFFTFQGISLVVDTYKGRELSFFSHDNVQNATGISLFISFFPQLVAGPIVKAHEFLPQIQTKYLKDIDWDYCISHLIMGYFLKMVIADNLKDQTYWMEYPHFESYSGLLLITLLLGYSMQIFADFAGYSLIAIGTAGIFGYRLKKNFDFPYISKTFSEFWRRWHISLSTFLKEYLYIPLGGNRKGKLLTYRNLVLTMGLGGLWHGAAWSYLVWGLYHGLALALERLLVRKKRSTDNWFVRQLRIIWIFSVVTLGWLLFKLPEFGQAVSYFTSIFQNGFMPSSSEFTKIFFTAMYSLPVIIYHMWYLNQHKIGEMFFSRYLKPAMLALLLFGIMTNAGTSGDFIYFQF